jgi:PAS domain S-box-containing protein
MNILNLFHKKKNDKVLDSHPREVLDDSDLKKLNDVSKMLKNTVSAVAEAAVEATRVLEERLRETEYRFFSTIDAIDDFVIIKDGYGRWKTVNKAGQEIFGWIHGEYYEKTDLQLARLFPLFTEALSMCAESDENAWEHKKTLRVQECIPYGIGGHKCFDILKTPIFDEFGKRKEMIIVGRDITEELEKNRRMKASFIALNSISDLIIILDFRGNIFFCNDAFLITFNICSYESIVGKHVCDILNIPGFDEMWELISHNQKWDGECSGDSLYGENRILSQDISVTPMMNGMPYPIYYICTLRSKKKKEDA